MQIGRRLEKIERLARRSSRAPDLDRHVAQVHREYEILLAESPEARTLAARMDERLQNIAAENNCSRAEAERLAISDIECIDGWHDLMLMHLRHGAIAAP